MHTTKARFRHRYRLARCQSLGTLATTLPRDIYDWFLSDVYDLRFPRICVQPFPRTFDSLERKPQHAYYMPVVDSKGNRFVISGGYKRIAGPFIKFGNDILKRLPSPL